MQNHPQRNSAWILFPLAVLGAFAFGRATAPQAVIDHSLDLGPLWTTVQILNEKYVPEGSTSTPQTVSNQDKVWGAVSGLVKSLGDPYTTFFPPDQSKIFEGDISGSFGGVGMEIGKRDGAITVIAPLKGTPAMRAGVRSGDIIAAINGKPTDDLSVEAAVQSIRGKKGTSVSLTLIREGRADPIQVALVRDQIEIPTIDTENPTTGAAISSVPAPIFVIRLYNFSGDSPDLFRNALQKFVDSGKTRLIIDLRGNPGGYLEAAVDMASWFLPKDVLVVTESSGGHEPAQVYKSKGYDIFNTRLKLVLLVDQGTASAAEIFAAALREHGVGTIVGERTFGKGSVQELIPVTADTSIKVTVARWYTPNGESLSNGGIVPDVVVTPTEKDIAARRDVQFDKAVSILLHSKP